MIFTFYSFKGGVGRSMALANIAELFYERGMRVLMVDFDLEAPGLERYFDVKNAMFSPEEIEARRGVIDMLLSYKELRSLPSLKTETDTVTAANEKKCNFPFSVEPLDNFIVRVYNENNRHRKDNRTRSLSILPAGQRSKGDFENYAYRVRSFNWDDFYTNWDGERFFNWFQESLREQADVVLIDSRTGVTEMSGVCTHQLADAVVTFVAPNNQNIDGVVKIARSLTNSELIEKGRKGRKLSLIFVPSRVEFNEGTKLDQFADQFQNKLSKYFPEHITFWEKPFDYLQIPYVPYYAYTEEVATRESSRAKASKMVKAFSNLADILEQLLHKPTRERPRIFISHAKVAEPDEQLAGEIYRAFARDYDVFVDKDISMGVDWVQIIDSEIRQADFFIVLISEHSANSEMVKAETIRACQLSREQNGRPRVLPIHVSLTQGMPYDLAAHLSRIQGVQWESPASTPRLLNELYDAIASNEGFSSQPDMGQTTPDAPELPYGAMSIDSPFYIRRSSDDLAMEAIKRQGVSLIISGARQFGKSSLLMRMLAAAQESGKLAVRLDFQLFDSSAINQPDLFFKSFCSWLSDRLNLEDRSDEFWRNQGGNIRLCTNYMERHVLPSINRSLVLAMDEVDRILAATFRVDFFSMLRAWSDQRDGDSYWRYLDLVLVISKDPYAFTDPHTSPFNVAGTIHLEDFSLKEVKELNHRYKDILREAEVKRLFQLLGGHPQLTQHAIYLVSSARLTPEQLFTQAADETGPFGDHLRRHLLLLQREQLTSQLIDFIRTKTYKDENAFRKLREMGLVRAINGVPVVARQLYLTYFSKHLNIQPDA